MAMIYDYSVQGIIYGNKRKEEIRFQGLLYTRWAYSEFNKGSIIISIMSDVELSNVRKVSMRPFDPKRKDPNFTSSDKTPSVEIFNNTSDAWSRAFEQREMWEYKYLSKP